jgi:hypothetical protein
LFDQIFVRRKARWGLAALPRPTFSIALVCALIVRVDVKGYSSRKAIVLAGESDFANGTNCGRLGRPLQERRECSIHAR